MSKILDQNESFSYSEYYKTTTDRVMNRGNIFDGTRKILQLHSFPYYNSEAFSGFNSFYDEVATWELDYAKTNSTKNMFLKINSVDELVADSVLPRPMDIVLTNGGRGIEGLGNETQQREWVFSDEKVYEVSTTPKKFKIVLGTTDNSSTLTSSSDSLTVSDNIWCHSFPYEIKYAGLDRLVKPSFDKSYYIEVSGALMDDVNSPGNTNAVPISASDHLSPFYSNIYSIAWLYRQADYQDASIVGKMCVISILDRGFKFDSYGQFSTSASFYPRIEKINTAFYGFSKAKVFDPSVYNSTANQTSNYASLINKGKFISTYGINSQPDEVSGYRRNAYIADYPLIIHGWKYGVYNANPSKTNCVFRRGKFGQPRDMLEQRPFMKYLDLKTNQYAPGPLTVTFVSGTSTYVTASNSSLNTRDSGIYDFEGKSGRPFFDT